MAHIPTLRELAALAGVSRTTISLALRNSPSLPLATRERIQALAAEHGYAPDPLVSSLMNRLRTARNSRPPEKMAYLTWWDGADDWRSSPNDLQYFQGAQERAAQLGYELEHIWAREPRMTYARLSRVLYTRAVRGLVLAPIARPRGHVSLDWQHFATTAISYTITRPNLHRVSHAHYQGMLMTMRKLRHLGYRRIGLANFSFEIERVNHAWLAGFLVVQDGMPERQHVPHLLLQQWEPEKFAAWLEQNKPDVVISNTHNFLVHMQELGLRVPQDIGYSCLDRLNADDPWAGVDQQPRVVGAAAVDLASAQLQRNEFGLPTHPKTMHLDGLWADGPTLRPQR